MEQTKGSINPFSKESFLGIKGYLAILILIHHLYQFTAFLSDTSFGYALYLLGHYGVVCFLFLSGFGLFSSYKAKGETYINSFLRNRVLPFYLSYLFFVLIYTIYSLLNHGSVSVVLMLQSLTFGSTIVNFGWYFQTALLMYLLFFIIRKLIANDSAFVLVLGGAILLFIFSYYFLISSSKTNYEPAFSFFVGVLFAYINDQKKAIFSKHPWLITVCGLVIFIALAAFSTFYNFRYNDYKWVPSFEDFIYLLLTMLSDLALAVFLTGFIAWVGTTSPRLIDNPVSRFFGNHSLEIYGLQGLFLSFLENKIGNRAIYAAVAVLCIIVVAIPVHKLLGLIKKRITATKSSQSC